MDKEKTGGLIAAARKAKDLTQKDLAKLLHVSDRAVSKWERGAGFPDVSLLEPLAEALDLNVLDLLRGEQTEESDVHSAVQEALAAFQEKRRQNRKYVLTELAKALAFLLVFGSIVSLVFPLRRSVDQTITAGVYVDGELAAYTDVEIRGEIAHTLVTGHRSYWGRFAIGCVEWTTREQANGGISLNGEGGVSYAMPGTGTRELYDPDTIMSADLREFAFALQAPNHMINDRPRPEHWCVLATSPEVYEAYRSQMGYGPPALKSPHSELLPDFPSAWKRW